jgi:hypothetical protein
MKLPLISSTSLPNAFAVSSGALRVTDPCYNMETWCAGTLENVKNGIWQAQVGYHKDELDMSMSAKWLAKYEEAAKSATDSFTKEYNELHAKKTREHMDAYKGRVAYLHIRHDNAQSHFDHAAEFDSTWVDSDIDVGVDSSQAGFFDFALFDQMCGSPPLKDKFYDEVCALTCDTEGQWGVHPVGTVSSTGWGDGSYNCLVRRDEELKAIEAIIIYMMDHDEEDDSDD